MSLSFRTQLILGIGALVVGSLGTVAGLVLREEEAALVSQLTARGREAARALSAAAVGPLVDERFRALNDLTAELWKEGDLAYAMVLDPSGRCLAHTDGARVGHHEPRPPYAYDFAAGEPAEGELRDERTGERFLDFSAPVKLDAGLASPHLGTARVGYPRRVVDDMTERARRSLLVLFAVAMAAGVALAALLAALVTRPLHALGVHARSLGEGDLETPVPASPGAELGVLSQTLEEMRLRVRAQLDALRRTNADLDRRLREVETLHRETERLYDASITDGLTGLRVARYFHDRLEDETLQARDTHSTLSLVLVDLDFFKRVNDEHGHPAGDALLRELAGMLRETTREGVDFAARYGGEEFAVVLPRTGRAGAAALAERLRARVEATRFCEEEVPGGLRATLSAGVATFPDDAADARALVRAADARLYRAKSEGRNRVCKDSG